MYSPPCLISRRRLLASFALRLPAAAWATNACAAADATGIALLSDAPPGIDPGGFLVSEKFDGVRALWDGRALRFRSGRLIAAPAWFTDALPATALDGELWSGRGAFDALSGTVRQRVAKDAPWRAVRLMAFDAPDRTGVFADRLRHLSEVVQHAASPQLLAVTQSTVTDHAALRRYLTEVVAAGGEGLVLRRANAMWAAGRNHDLLKLKPLHDAEAQVLAHEAGHGRLTALMGALHVRTADGSEFRIGTGFTDRERRDPPPLGSWITYTHRGFTSTGVPRFASFLRRRDDDV